MRKILLVTIIILCAQRVALAQYVWAAPDNNSHYVEIECRANADGSILLDKQQKPALEYLGVLLNMHRDKIKNGEWTIWVESYVKAEGGNETQNRARAKLLSNTIKSYMISNYKIVESDFTTRNYSGTISKKQNITTVVIGLRYPMEKILTEQLVDWESQDVARLKDAAQTDPFIVVNYGELSARIPGVDTSKIYSPRFEPTTFSYKAPAPKLMEVKDGRASSASDDYDGQQETSLMSDSVLMAQKAIQDLLNSPTYVQEPQTKREKQRLRQEKLRAKKTKKQRQPSTEIYGGLNVAMPNADSTKDYLGSSLLTLDQQFGANDAQNKEKQAQANKKSTNTLDNGYTPYPSISGFAPAPSNVGGLETADVKPIYQVIDSKIESAKKGSEEFSSSDFVGKKVRVRKSKRGDFAPKVVYDAQGRMTIDATGLERSLNAENVIRLENENKSIRVAEQRLLREQIVDQKYSERRAIQQAKGRFAVFGVGINALTSAALIPSMQFDAYFSDRFSALVEGFYSKWNYDNNYKFNVLMVSPELRFFPMGDRKAFNGLYVGIYGSYGHYNTRWDSRTGYQSDFLSAGVSLGYVLPIGESGFHLEAGLSAGYLNQWGDKYTFHHGDNYHIEPHKNTKYFYPTKIKVSFVYRIFNQKKTYESENY